MEQTIVALQVGISETIFYLHRGILSARSPSFEEADLDSPWKETQENVMSLPDTEPGIFEAFVIDWMYTGQILEQPDWLLLEGYIFALRYDVPGLRDHIVRDFYSAYVWGDEVKLPAYQLVSRAFKALSPERMLCKLFLELYEVGWSSDADDEEAAEERDKLPAPFVRELLVRLGRGEGRSDSVGYLSDFLESSDE
ncbi:hypothetical protein DIS24_g5557 [Lasiodiplodia hormozganensis]|uniref:BTB domain-containing protein n=1 Tax=Lasiodiplodia hormozganensis TaxID=869390 RepID=A0AA39YKJ6_9PEZI|nr:hypothetical protein DIS24_g5557 [Lasiodiplodia hormozganensis]